MYQGQLKPPPPPTHLKWEEEEEEFKKSYLRVLRLEPTGDSGLKSSGSAQVGENNLLTRAYQHSK